MYSLLADAVRQRGIVEPVRTCHGGGDESVSQACVSGVPHTGRGDAPVVALFSGVTPGTMAVPTGGGSVPPPGVPAVKQLPYTSLSAFCAAACSSSATPTHDVEVRDETEGLEEGAAAQRVDGGIGLDVLATQGW